MAVKNAMFLFEVVVENVTSFVESRHLLIKGDFADIFSLELRDPKTMQIVMPEAPPLPPDPKAKKGKPKPPKPKKGKKGKEEAPPPAPAIQSGQSVLFTSSAEFVTETMKKFPMEVSLWSKEDHLVYIGGCSVPWDPVFYIFLQTIYDCKPTNSVTVKDEYNIFEEGGAKILAKMTIQIKLSYLTDRATMAFRTTSEDPGIRRWLFTGMNSKTTSYMCTLKTNDKEFEENCKKIKAKFFKDKELSNVPKPNVFADYKNAPGAQVPLLDDVICCGGHTDKPPDDKYSSPETMPDIDFICEYVRKIISSCNDSMRMLTPRPTITPRARATDIDKLCYCRETKWPQSALAERFRKEVQGPPCPVCIQKLDRRPRPGTKDAPKKVFDIANITGPCGRADCRIARDMSQYLEKLYDETNKEILLSDIVGPCGSRDCTLVDKILDFLQHKGVFSHGGATIEGLPTQCECIKTMQNALVRKGSCDSLCSVECEDSDSDFCGGNICPYKKNKKSSNISSKTSSTTAAAKPAAKPPDKPPPKGGVKPKTPPESPPKSPPQSPTPKKVATYFVYYFTVQPSSGESTAPSSKTPSASASQAASKPPPASGSQTPPTPASKPPPAPASKPPPAPDSKPPPAPASKSPPSPSSKTPATSGKSSKSKLKYCSSTCPVKSKEVKTCSKAVCETLSQSSKTKTGVKCVDPKCPRKEEHTHTPSPADSNIVINFKDIKNPCCVKSCEVAERVKDFIAEGVAKKSKSRPCLTPADDPCYCDCNCTFRLSAQTTYCPVCGGYECLGDDVRAQPEFRKPHPCPVYHKLYENQYFKIKSPYQTGKAAAGTKGTSSGKAISSKSISLARSRKDIAPTTERKSTTVEKVVVKKKEKKAGKATTKKTAAKTPAGQEVVKKNNHAVCRFTFEAVPKNMGWLWTADDIPGLKVRPKWKPGAANKILVRRYRAIRQGIDIIAKKKRAMLRSKKKVEMKPTLVVTKKDGEYTVQMEVFKKYSKERLPYQYPYDEKPPLIYTIGKTEDTKAKIQRQRERRERRETRRKSRLLQSTFRDKCQEICLKAYNQAIGLVPTENPNFLDCPCDIQAIKQPTPVIDSCSCSDSASISSSDTDGDDWVIEFTAPLATWDIKAKHVPTYTTCDSQYTYLDYRVKLVDRQGNQVPRFFIGPDGKQMCSDLGGFYDKNHQWLEINKDGYVGPDQRWVPQSFIGPDGSYYTSDEGSFTDASGKTFKIGVDGYIDCNGKWAWYPKGRRVDKAKSASTMTGPAATKTARAAAKPDSPKMDRAKPIKSALASPAAGKEKKTAATTTDKDTTQKKVTYKGQKSTVMNVELSFLKRPPSQMMHSDRRDRMGRIDRPERIDRTERMERIEKIKEVEATRIAKYQEIMDGLQMYDDLELRPPIKTNRACNTQPRLMAKGDLTRNSSGTYS